MVSNELLVVEDFDGSRTLDEIEFPSILIWVRVANLPLGLMNRATAEAIGDEICVFMEMEADVEPDEVLAGRFLHLKVRLDIRKPLMWGVTVSLYEGEKDRWCPLSYEFMSDSCYCCGIIRHIDMTCQMNVGKKTARSFGKELCYIPQKRRFGGDKGRSGAWRRSLPSGSMGSGNESSGGRPRSDVPSWRRPQENVEWR